LAVLTENGYSFVGGIAMTNYFFLRQLRPRNLIFLAVTLIALGLTLSSGFAKSSRSDKSSGPESRFTTLDGARIHYVNYGKGKEALILIHGWTMNVDNWRDNFSDLAKRNRVIAIDLPGHGQSDKPQTTYSMELFARAIEAVMRDANVKRAVLVGHSMGTPIARQFYRRNPAKTLGIVIADGSLRPFGNKALIAGFRAPGYRDQIDQMFAMMMGKNLSTDAQDRIKSSSANTPQNVLVSAFEGMADPAIWGEDQIAVPVLAIMARNPFYPPNVEESFRKIAPKMEFHMWDGAGHFVMMERPKDFDEFVLAWLDKNNLLKK
jgi:pimeloyl-ACP methyl ester carboxylesterase